MKVAIGVPTYNRRHLVELNAASLCSSSIPPGTELIVVDDVSTAYDVEFLRSIYPKFADIRRRSESSGDSSFASRDVMRQLLETDADALLLLDSDFLVSSNFLSAGVSLLPETDGVLSLFNTPNHPVTGSRGPVVLKKSIGCAGSLWRRDIAAKVFSEVPGGPRWDWRFSDFLVEAKIEICVVRNSLVQHAGYSDGENSNFNSGDFGVGFSDSDAKNAYRLAELLLADSQAKFRRVQEQINALDTRARQMERSMLLYRMVRSVRRLFKKPLP
jgi:glycosyltransferase involved in cell wall biosynthesis